MSMGRQFVCRKSIDGFVNDELYYFVGDRPEAHVLMARFYRAPEYWRVLTIELPRQTFERYLSKQVLVVNEPQSTLPPWLKQVEGINFEDVESRRYPNKKRTVKEQVEQRLTYIAEAAAEYTQWLQSKSALRAISGYAKDFGSTVNRARFQLWVFAYLLHGRNPWSLKAPSHNCGTWSRSAPEHAEKKFGRPSKDPRTPHNGPASATMELCVKGFLAHSGPGVTLYQAYLDTLTKTNGCKVITREDGTNTFHHPLNIPIPSYYQFRRNVILGLGLEQYQTRLYGRSKLRDNATHHQGTFTAQYSNILECLHVDGYSASDLPRRLLNDGPAQALLIAEGICGTTGLRHGMGFGFGSETKIAYRTMLFCCVVPKQLIERMFGLTQGDLANSYYCGEPRTWKSDRGPGGSIDLLPDFDRPFAVRSMTPSHSGQSNSLSEATHTRDRDIGNAPSTRLSALNTIEMMKRELLRMNAANGSTDISARLPPHILVHFSRGGIKASPINYNRYLDKHCRSSAGHITVETAVRTYLEKKQFILSAVGARLAGQEFNSPAFRRCRTFRQQPSHQTTLTGYVFEGVVRIVWVEAEGELFELEALSRDRTNGEDRYLTLTELEEIDKARSVMRSEMRNHRNATKVKAHQSFEEQTGKGWSEGKTVNKRIGRKSRGDVAETDRLKHREKL